MALTGNWKHYTYSEHPTETTPHTVTYPVNLTQDHPDYDKRGTTETVYTAVLVENYTEYPNVYVNIKSLQSWYHHSEAEGSLQKAVDVNIQYRVYKSQNDYLTNPEDIDGMIISNHELSVPMEGTQLDNLYSSSYSHLNNLQGFENLTKL